MAADHPRRAGHPDAVWRERAEAWLAFDGSGDRGRSTWLAGRFGMPASTVRRWGERMESGGWLVRDGKVWAAGPRLLAEDRDTPEAGQLRDLSPVMPVGENLPPTTPEEVFDEALRQAKFLLSAPGVDPNYRFQLLRTLLGWLGKVELGSQHQAEVLELVRSAGVRGAAASASP